MTTPTDRTGSDPAGAVPAPQEAEIDVEAVQGGMQWPWQRLIDGR